MPNNSDLRELEAADAQPYSEAIITSRHYQDFKQRVRQQSAEVFTPRDASPEVIAISAGQDQAVIGRIPFDGGAGGSGFVAIFQPNSTIISETRAALST